MNDYVIIEPRPKYNPVTVQPHSVVRRAGKMVGWRVCGLDEVVVRGAHSALSSAWFSLTHALGIARDIALPPSRYAVSDRTSPR